jgi:hypothetical protein
MGRKGGMGLVDIALPALLVTANQSYQRRNKSNVYGKTSRNNKFYSRRTGRRNNNKSRRQR